MVRNPADHVLIVNRYGPIEAIVAKDEQGALARFHAENLAVICQRDATRRNRLRIRFNLSGGNEDGRTAADNQRGLGDPRGWSSKNRRGTVTDSWAAGDDRSCHG